MASEGKKDGWNQYVNKGYTPNTNNIWNSKDITSDYNGARIMIRQGTNGSNRLFTFDDFSVITNNNNSWNTDKKKAGIKVIGKRFLVDRHRMFKDMMNFLFAFCIDMQDLVEIKIPNRSTMVIDYAGLGEHCINLLNSVKKNLEKFRGVIDRQTIKKFEGGDRGDSKYARPEGTIYWMEQHLIGDLIKGERRSRDDNSLNRANEIISGAFQSFTRKWDYVPFTIYDNADVFANFLNPDKREGEIKSISAGNAKKCAEALQKLHRDCQYDSYDEPMAELLFWDLYGSNKAAGGGGTNFLHKMFNSDTKSVAPNNRQNWPFEIVPSVDHLTPEDVDAKRIKNLSIRLEELFQVLKSYRSDFGTPASGSPFYRDMGDGKSPDATKFPAVAVPVFTGDIAPTAQGSVGWGNADSKYCNHGAPEYIPLDENIFASVAARQMASTPIVGAAADEAKRRKYVEIINAYRSLYKQRDLLRTKSLNSPLYQRMLWYLFVVQIH